MRERIPADRLARIASESSLGSMTKSRRVYVGLLTTAVAALGVDQFILQGEPEAASATPTGHVGAAPAAPLDDAASENDRLETLAQVLASLDSPPIVDRNCFSIPEDWRPEEAVQDTPSSGEPLPLLVLTSTSPAGAVINGQPVRVGDAVDANGSIRLVSVGESAGRASAIVEFSGVRYRLLVGSKTPEIVVESSDSAARAGEGG